MIKDILIILRSVFNKRNLVASYEVADTKGNHLYFLYKNGRCDIIDL